MGNYQAGKEGQGSKEKARKEKGGEEGRKEGLAALKIRRSV